MATFFKMKRLFFEDIIDDEKYCGVLFGLGLSWTPPVVYPQHNQHGMNEWSNS